MELTRAVHGSGGSVLDPTRTRPVVRRVGGGGTRNRPPASLGRVGFGFGWCSGRFGRLRESPDPAKRRRNLQKIRRNLQKPSRSAPKIAEIGLDLLESRQISQNMVEISLGSPRMLSDLTKFRLDLLKCHRISPNLA